MNDDKIKCPKCGTSIEVDQLMVQRIRENIENEARKKLTLEFDKRLNFELEKVVKEKTLEEEGKLEKIKLELESKNKKIDEFREQELKLHKEKIELEEAKKNLEIQTQRRLAETQKAVEEKMALEFSDKYKFIIAEKDKQLNDQKKLTEEANRKLNQGSMQTQGEVMELALEELLKKNFAHDLIEPVPKGITGADIIQRVVSDNGNSCGAIVWESKQTKAWTEEWVQKLKDDGRNIKGDILVLVSETLPKEINSFGFYKGVWVSNFSSILGLTSALRAQLVAVSNTVVAETDKDEKMELIYKYICSNDFAQKIQSSVETFDQLRKSIEIEKRAMNKIWASRESQIMRLTENTAKLYGEIQGIAGSQLPSIELLELTAAAETVDESKKDKKNNKTEDMGQAGLF